MTSILHACRRYVTCWALAAVNCVPLLPAHGGEPVPASIRSFLAGHCVDCHQGPTAEAEMDLGIQEIDWQTAARQSKWERVLRVLKDHAMPPKDSRQPGEAERENVLQWIDASLSKHTNMGGGLPRRLNQGEYRSTVKSLFGLKDFSLPRGFPADREYHGFDNLGEGLVLSPPLLEAYAETAQSIADRVFPPTRISPAPESHHAKARDLVISYSSAKVVDGALRLGMKCDPIQRSCTWPSRFEAEVSGVYRVQLSLSCFAPRDGQSMLVKVLARDVASRDGVSHRSLRLLQELSVSSTSQQTHEFDVELYAGQTLVVHWANATLDSDRADKEQLQAFFRQRDEANPKYLAAWHAMLDGVSGQGFRGGSGWERVKSQLRRDDLPALTDKQKSQLLKKIGGNTVLYAETVVFDVFENGPALQVHGLDVSGPHRLVDGPMQLESRKLQASFFGTEENLPAPDTEASARAAISRLLAAAFRRPLDELTKADERGGSIADVYWSLYRQHRASEHSREEAMHLVIRNVLISPRFLYRGLRAGPLDDFDLATRLSYFLTGAPPDGKLAALAAVGELTKGDVLRRQAKRLMPERPTDRMVIDFTEQWLDTRKLADIMPDAKLKFSAKDMQSAKAEVEHFFAEMLRENRPMQDFIVPDFTWTSARLAKNIYELDSGFDPKKSNVVHRVSLPKDGRYGGVLGMAAVHVATANGVDTQPVLRGVWVLENVLGDPPPPPPNAVPPITPDTNGAKTPRQLLAAHTSQASCSACHHKIDPVGMALENFDPVGRWREQWPGGAAIDSSGRLPDGTVIRDVRDLRTWLVENREQFSQCVAEKLMTYGTGRVLNYAERKEVAAIVAKHEANRGGFRDLVLDLIESTTFRTK